MRLRLRIERNGLPTVSTLWPVTDPPQKKTIAQFIEAVNQAFPLEGDRWGLEDYIVTVADFECLHYHYVSDVCKDDEEVVVRPLTYAEVRSRTLTGRSQISSDGKKLTDGIAFGKPLLKAPVRPEVMIPPRKRKRATADEDDGGKKKVRFITNGDAEVHIECIPPGGHKMTMAPERDEHQEDEDGGFELGDDGKCHCHTSSDAENGFAGVAWHPADSEPSDSDSSDSCSGDPDSSDSDSSDSDSSDSDSSESTDSSSDSSSDESSHNSSHVSMPTSAALSTGATANAVGGGEAGSALPASHCQQSAVATPLPSLPHAGKMKTQKRNARRRESKKLAYLKGQGILAQDADFTTLREWEEAQYSTEYLLPNHERGDSDPTSTATLDDADENGSPENETESGFEATGQNLQQSARSDDIMLNSRGEWIPEEDFDEGPEVQSNKLEARKAALMGRLHQQNMEGMAANERGQGPVAGRRGVNVAGAERLLYGSLGVRTPQSQEQREAVQRTLAARLGTAAPKRKSDSQDEELAVPEEKEEAEDIDWHEHIELLAIECCDEGVQLATPPFPFHQHWDPQYPKKENQNTRAYTNAPRKRRRRNRRAIESANAETYDNNNEGYGDALDYYDDGAVEGAYMVSYDMYDDEDYDDEDYDDALDYDDDGAVEGAYTETYDTYNKDGYGDALDWDGDGTAYDHGYWEGFGDEEDPAAQQLLDEATAAAPVDDFPALPQDLSSLKAMTSEDAQVGDFVTFTELVLSTATNWQPEMLRRTVQLLEKEGDVWTMKLALRDLAPKEYDDQGDRVYGKFDMAPLNGEEELSEEEERLKVASFAELNDARLLQRAEVRE